MVLGGKGHKARWIGLGILIQGVGIFIFALPQLFGDLYTYQQSVSIMNLAVCFL